MGMHDGHRRKMREEFLAGGLDAFSEHRALELLLFYAIPQADVNPVAHALIDAFGSISAVFDAEPEELMRVPGIGQNAAVLLKLIPQVCRRYLISKTSFIDIIDSSETAGAYLMPRFHGRKEELVYLLCMDAKRKLISCKLIGSGSMNSVVISVRKVVETALVQGASCVILAHNHTSGIALKSEEDVKTTIRIRDALAQVDVVLLDHLIIAGDDFISFRDDGILNRRSGTKNGEV